MSLRASLGAGALAVLLSACGGGDTWYDGTATLTTTLIRHTTKPVTSTAQFPVTVDDRGDEGGYHVNITAGDAFSCYLTPIDMVSVGGVDTESFATPPTASFSTAAGPATAIAVMGSGTIGSDGSQSLDLSFAIEQADTQHEAFSGTIVLAFRGNRRPGQ
jgi:hypothetical protein